MKRPVVVVIVSVVLSLCMIACVIGAWNLLYPAPHDPRNFRYVMWKRGIGTLPAETIYTAMVGDAGRDQLVIGKTREAVRSKFGELYIPKQTKGEYLSDYYYEGPYKGEDMAYLGKTGSQWIVIFRKGRASKLVLVKGW